MAWLLRHTAMAAQPSTHGGKGMKEHQTMEELRPFRGGSGADPWGIGWETGRRSPLTDL